MAFNHEFWAEQLQGGFPAQAEALARALEDRLLPAFQHIDREATELRDRRFHELCSTPHDDRVDISDLHQIAFEEGLEHYSLLSGIKQGLINMTATSLSHLYEQQCLYFMRREILHPAEQNYHNLLKREEFVRRLLDFGVDLTTFPSAAKLHELSHLANTIKHGQGRASKQLFALRPDLFQHPAVSNTGFLAPSAPHIFIPVMGEDIYVGLNDIHQYATSIARFWHEFFEAIAKI